MDFVVVGSGIAALRAAIELADAGEVLIITKDDAAESNTAYAQGGIAAAMSDTDNAGLHFQDTVHAGDGLCDPAAVGVLVTEGPDAVRQLIHFGARLDHDGARLSLTREAAHSRARVVHAGGDSTGREIVRALLAKVRSITSIHLRSHAFLLDLRVFDGRVTGATFEIEGRTEHVAARGVLLATGGVGQAFRETTNPAVATGDGIAAAYRAGAVLRDLEFVQFHPTVLHIHNAPRFLLSEAMRGEGAFLINATGDRFTNELAPRDVVARAIYQETLKQGGKHVFLDLRHLDPKWTQQRFPGIYKTCLSYGIDITKVPAPIQPAAHYLMGGIRTDLEGRTNVPGLFAAGEVASTGVHGANRLASNSLVEGLVFGRRAAVAMKSELEPGPNWILENPIPDALTEAGSRPYEIRRTVQEIMWNCAGIVREREKLENGLHRLKQIEESLSPPIHRFGRESRNLLQVGRIILQSSLARQESRGAHYRSDYPERDDTDFLSHSIISLDNPLTFESR
jgi:L-aspartate oxidase